MVRGFPGPHRAVTGRHLAFGRSPVAERPEQARGAVGAGGAVGQAEAGVPPVFPCEAQPRHYCTVHESPEYGGVALQEGQGANK